MLNLDPAYILSLVIFFTRVIPVYHYRRVYVFRITMSDGYSELHRTLLTYIRAVKYIGEQPLQNDFREMAQTIDPEMLAAQTITTDELLSRYVTTINTRISDHGFKIERRVNEIEGTLCYVFVNATMDEYIKSATNYSPKELHAIKLVIDDIVEAPEFAFSVGRVNAQLRIAGCLNRTLREAAQFVDRLIDDGWVTLTSEEKLILSIKLVVELKHYLVDRYSSRLELDQGKILTCLHCGEIVTIGQVYQDQVEPMFFHFKCLAIYNRSSQTNPERLRNIGVAPETIEQSC